MLHVSPPTASAPVDARAIGTAAFVLRLRSRGLRDTVVLGAMERVPRDAFAPRRYADLAHTDVALPLPCGQTMTAPSIVAGLLLRLGVEAGQRVLEIGTGSGYVSALLARLGARVVTVERFGTLAEEAAGRLDAVGVGEAVKVEVGDGLQARGDEARFERILINGAVRFVPAALTSLLTAGGRLIGAELKDGVPRLIQIDRSLDGVLRHQVGGALRVTRLASGRAAAL